MNILSIISHRPHLDRRILAFIWATFAFLMLSLMAPSAYAGKASKTCSNTKDRVGFRYDGQCGGNQGFGYFVAPNDFSFKIINKNDKVQDSKSGISKAASKTWEYKHPAYDLNAFKMIIVKPKGVGLKGARTTVTYEYLAPAKPTLGNFSLVKNGDNSPYYKANVTFDVAVKNFVASQVAVTNGTVKTITGSNKNWVLEVWPSSNNVASTTAKINANIGTANLAKNTGWITGTQYGEGNAATGTRSTGSHDGIKPVITAKNHTFILENGATDYEVTEAEANYQFSDNLDTDLTTSITVDGVALTFPHTFDEGDYTVHLRTEDDFGNVTKKTVNIHVTESPPPDLVPEASLEPADASGFLVPSAVVVNTITITNEGLGTVDPDTMEFIIPIPDHVSLYLKNIDNQTQPIIFTDGTVSSGLTFTYTSLASATDSVSFSNDDGNTYDYQPTTAGAEPDITHMKISLDGTFAGKASDNDPNCPSFDLKYQTQIN